LIIQGIARFIGMNKCQADGTNLLAQRLVAWVLLQSCYAQKNPIK